MSGFSKPSAGCGYSRIAMNSGLAKALGVMMKSTPQIADGLEALHRAVTAPKSLNSDRMLHPLHPKIDGKNQNEKLRILLNPGKIAQVCQPG